MRSVILSALANRDLQSTWEYIARRSVDAADRVAGRLRTEMLSLAETPGKGHRRRDVKSDRFLFSAVDNHIIAYRYTRNRLYVVRVIHGARDFTRIFRPRKRRS